MDDDLVFALRLQEEWDMQMSERALAQEPLSLVDASWELVDPTPDLQALFMQFNDQFFWGQLEAVEVKWSARMTLEFVCLNKKLDVSLIVWLCVEFFQKVEKELNQDEENLFAYFVGFQRPPKKVRKLASIGRTGQPGQRKSPGTLEKRKAQVESDETNFVPEAYIYRMPPVRSDPIWSISTKPAKKNCC